MSSLKSFGDLERLFEFDLYIPTRTVYMGSCSHDWNGDEAGVDFMMAERVIKALHVLDVSAPSGDKPINIVMNNPGGDYYHGLAIFDAITACKNHVTITVFGYAMSMGSIILQAADERVMSPNSRMMLHYGHAGYHDTPRTVINWAAEFKKSNDWMDRLFLDRIHTKHPDYTLKKVRDLLSFDTILSAQETIDLGLADRLVQ